MLLNELMEGQDFSSSKDWENAIADFLIANEGSLGKTYNQIEEILANNISVGEDILQRYFELSNGDINNFERSLVNSFVNDVNKAHSMMQKELSEPFGKEVRRLVNKNY